MLRRSLLVTCSAISILLLTLLSITISPAHAANCEGLPITGGFLPAGDYLLTDNCHITDTFQVIAGTVTIRGNGFFVDGNNIYQVFRVLAGATLNLNDITIQHGFANDGAGIQNLAGTVSINNSTITTNMSNFSGGAIQNSGYLTVTNSTLSDNSTLDIFSGFGGAIYNMGGTLDVVNSVFTNNRADEGGGAILNRLAGILSIDRSVFTSNRASGGGALSSDFGTTLSIHNSVFSANDSASGGALRNSGTGLITNSTFSGNTAAVGGAIIAYDTTTIINTTITGNSSQFASGGIQSSLNAGPIITNSILSSNIGGNCNFPLNDGGGNLEDTDTCGFGAGANTNPMLSTFNGSYYPLLAGSPAIDGAPTCAGLTNDQIGTTRPQGTACDIGAIEMPVDPVTGELIPIVNPAVPSLNEWNATATENRAEAYAVDDNVYATIHMQNGAWQYNSGGISQDLIDYGVIMAIDVWELGGDQVFDHYEKVCLLGEGRLIYFDATQSPRPMTEITPITLEDGYTCGWIPNAGTLVLIEPE